MNPFAAHNENMQAYEAMCAEPVNGQAGGFVFYRSDQKPNGEQYPATVGVFSLQQFPSKNGGGWSPSFGSLAEVIVRKDVLPAGVAFKTGKRITATQIGGSQYQCEIILAQDTFTE